MSCAAKPRKRGLDAALAKLDREWPGRSAFVFSLDGDDAVDVVMLGVGGYRHSKQRAMLAEVSR